MMLVATPAGGYYRMLQVGGKQVRFVSRKRVYYRAVGCVDICALAC